jgi:hypothetical protein
MTEQEWSVCAETSRMLTFLRDRVGERKLRLFMAGCCRRTWHLIPDERCRKAFDVAERFADGQVGDQELYQAHSEICRLPNELKSVRKGAYLIVDSWRRAVWPRERSNMEVFRRAAFHLAAAVADCDFLLPWPPPNLAAFQAEEQAQCDLLRHIFGNLFRPYGAPARWPSAVVQLAASLVEGQDCWFALHNALLEAGHPQLAMHFREKQCHPRGCWVLDLSLGKSSGEQGVAADSGGHDGFAQVSAAPAPRCG